MQDWYEVLELKRNASAQDIRRAYRRLALRHHPDIDRTPGAKERFQRILQAYQVLSDPVQRAAFDYRGQMPPPTQPRRGPVYRSRKSQDVESEIQLILSLKPYATWFSRIFFAFGLLILLDFMMPSVVLRDRVHHVDRYRGYCMVYTVDGHTVELGSRECRILSRVPDFEIDVSALLGMIRALRLQRGEVVIRNLASVYGNFAFLPVGWVLLMIASVVFRSQVRGSFYVGLTQFFFSLIAATFFVVSVW